MKYIKLTTAQALVRFLDNQYVSFDGHEEKFIEGVFTIFGHGNVLGIGQALEENPGDLKVHQGRNEQGMALAATAFAKQSALGHIYAPLPFFLPVTSMIMPSVSVFKILIKSFLFFISSLLN